MMKMISLFFKRLYWRYILAKHSKCELFKMLKQPDPDVADLVWRAFVNTVTDVRELMVIVYDDHGEFRHKERTRAGRLVLVILKESFGGLYLPGTSWIDTTHGRLAYLTGVGLYLPELRGIARAIVETSFYPHERAAFQEINLDWGALPTMTRHSPTVTSSSSHAAN